MAGARVDEVVGLHRADHQRLVKDCRFYPKGNGVHRNGGI